MEQWTEGKRAQRIKLDKAPWSWNKLRRKSSKQILWITFSMWTGFTFVGYFTPIRELGTDLIALNVGGWTLFWGIFYGFATYGNAGYMREQVCKYMCPYARFQSAMFDKDTLIISYDEERGEPRGGRKRSVASSACRFARQELIFAKGSNTSVLPVLPVSMPATRSWTKWTTREGWFVTRPRMRCRTSRRMSCGPACSSTLPCC
jgi:hypothetical protein